MSDNCFKDWDDMWNEESIPLKKIKRIKDEFKRSKIKNNRRRLQGGGATDKGSEGRDY